MRVAAFTLAAALLGAAAPAHAGDPLDQQDGTETWSDAHARRTRREDDGGRAALLRAIAEWESARDAWQAERLDLREERRRLQRIQERHRRGFVERGVDIVVQPGAGGAAAEPPSRPALPPARPAAAPRPASASAPRAAPAAADDEVPAWMREEARRLEERAGGWLDDDAAKGPRPDPDGERRAREAEAARAAAARREQEAAEARAAKERRESEAAEAKRLHDEAEERARAQAAVDAERERLEAQIRARQEAARKADEAAKKKADEDRRRAEAAQAAEDARKKREADERTKAEKMGGHLDESGQFVDPETESEFENLSDDDF